MTGDQGQKGFIGDQGEEGLAGESGDQGVEGIFGFQGFAGEDGEDFKETSLKNSHKNTCTSNSQGIPKHSLDDGCFVAMAMKESTLKSTVIHFLTIRKFATCTKLKKLIAGNFAGKELRLQSKN